MSLEAIAKTLAMGSPEPVPEVPMVAA